MCADLFLDTFPICAHTTASALWVGLPIVTMARNSIVAWGAGSEKYWYAGINYTYNYQDYKSKILELATIKLS